MITLFVNIFITFICLFLYNSIMQLKDKIKIAIFDIDSTLFDHREDRFTPSSINAIKKLHDKGIICVVSTARYYLSVKYLNTFNHYHFDAISTYNSGFVCTNDGDIIRQSSFKQEEVKNILEIARKHHIPTLIATPKEAFLVGKKGKVYNEYISHYKEEDVPCKKYEGEDVVGIVFFVKSYRDYIFKKLPYTHLRYSPLAIECTPETYQKGTGIKAILDYYGVKKENAICFGDDVIDISMFEEVKYSIAVGNAKEELKKIAYYVTDDIKDDGILKALKHFELI